MVNGINDEVYDPERKRLHVEFFFRRKLVIGNNDEIYDPERKRLHVENLVSQEEVK
jgi:hypothetical protein